jgi:DNA-binding NtrC family response regulator
MWSLPKLIGQSNAFRHFLQRLERCSGFDVPVLIRGETGTGKELAARAIHYMSHRRGGPFVPVNCGALPETLVENELFGSEPGAFTDARRRRDGLVVAAQCGTLFLDEVDALPPRAQAALLRFLQDQTFRPLGANREMTGDVRVVAAASQRLGSMVAQGEFRSDLAYRLDVLTLEMPPLRQRPGDACLLAEHFAGQFAQRYKLPRRPIEPASLRWLERYDWPGNVRELENLVHRQTLLGIEDELVLRPAGDVDGEAVSAPRSRSYHEARAAVLERWERSYLRRLLRVTQGNVTRAAQLAGKERRALGKLLKKHGIDRSSYAGR